MLWSQNEVIHPIAADPSLCEVDSSTLAIQVSNDVGIILRNISRVSAAELINVYPI